MKKLSILLAISLATLFLVSATVLNEIESLRWSFTPYEIGVKHIKYSEGFSEIPYKDGKYESIGFGSCTSSGLDMPDESIDIKTANNFVAQEYENIVKSMEGHLKKLPINTRTAFYMTAYRCGYPTVLNSKAVQLALEGDDEGAYKELREFKAKSLWDKNRQIVIAQIAFYPFEDDFFDIYDTDKKSPTYGQLVIKTNLKNEMNKYDKYLSNLYRKHNFKFKNVAG